MCHFFESPVYPVISSMAQMRFINETKSFGKVFMFVAEDALIEFCVAYALSNQATMVVMFFPQSGERGKPSSRIDVKNIYGILAIKVHGYDLEHLHQVYYCLSNEANFDSLCDKSFIARLKSEIDDAIKNNTPSS